MTEPEQMTLDEYQVQRFRNAYVILQAARWHLSKVFEQDEHMGFFRTN